MSVFYRGANVLITDEVFEVRSACRHRYAIAALRCPRIVREDPYVDRQSRAAGAGALAAAFVVVPLVGPVSRLVAGVAVAVLLAGAMLGLRRSRPVRWYLVADYDGAAVTLFAVTDQREFEQVCRGLQRCLEGRETRPSR